MPVYEYTCDACGQSFEHIAAMADAALETKPGCETGGCQLRKLISRCSGVIAGRNIVSALREASAAASPTESKKAVQPHSCSFYCDHK
jgi:putative FmdB family regulatory protein